MTAQIIKMPRSLHTLSASTVTMAHGGGGRAMRDLIEDVFIRAFDHEHAPLEDQARLNLEDMARHGNRLALTTDSYVIDPIFFPGGDIGKLAVCGTINDLAVGGATPLYLTCGVILEEGMDIADLRRIAYSMAETARAAGVRIVTGDTKVVKRGAGDKIFINTSGVGVIPANLTLGIEQVRAGDVVLVNGVLGDHGAAILAARGDFMLESPLESDCAALHGLIAEVLKAAPEVRFIRDATRGGLASLLNEVAEAAAVGIEIDEKSTPIRTEVKGTCEFLGLDPLYLANEGKIAVFVPPHQADVALAAMREHSLGRDAAVIGEVKMGVAGRVTMKTVFGGQRIVDMLVGDQLPRIC